MKLSFKEFQEGAKRTFADPPQKVQPNQLGEMHCVVGISTEAGELLDAYKKYVFYGKQLDLVNVKEEIGDIMWYIANFCTITNIDLEELLHANIEKLKLRYPDKFDSDKAINRDVAAERALLSEKL
jgi:NTP pyrophosphatase (non-canonical NTP hydrolase)